MDPLLVPSVAALVVDLLLLLGLGSLGSQLPGPLYELSLIALVAVFPCATISVLCVAEPRHRLRRFEVRWLIRLVGMPIGLWLVSPGIEPSLRIAGHVQLLAGFPRFLAGVALFAALAFKSSAELMGWAFERMPQLRLRITALSVIGAAVAVVLNAWVVGPLTAGAPSGVIVSMGIAITFVWGLSSTASFALTRDLESAVSALRRLGQGDLGATLAIRGRGEVADLGAAFNAAVASLREKEFVERAFGRYVAPDVLSALRAKQGLQLAAERQDATVLFADIRGFTSLSESASPEEVMRVLNAYFGRVVEVVGEHGGYINKFIGDAIMVVFNAPAPQADHARRGIACGRAIQDALAVMNAAGAFGARQLGVGIGVNTGPLVAGSLGGEARAEYTVIGDAVNVASRFTSAAKAGQVLVGERCAKESGFADLAALEPIKVKGKAEPLPVFLAR